MKVVIIEYNAGNVQSVLFALERLGVEALLTSDHEQIRSATHVLFPGVGEAGPAMQFLRQAGLDKLIPTLKCPVLGICLGLQLMCRHSQESNTDCMGIFEADVLHFDNIASTKNIIKDRTQKIPHIGWNHLLVSDVDEKVDKQAGISKLLKDLPPDPMLYYVHSYAASICEYTIAQTDYIVPFSAVLAHDNFYAIQAHPEKSAFAGQKIVENFLSL